MITKISKPSKSGKIVYDNKGSAQRLVNYLAHEAKPQGREVTYFNQTRSDITAQEVVQGIDGNQKGLRKEDAKFYSLIISPSAEELGHIGNDGRPHEVYFEKLKAYTRQVMEHYARNFKLKDGKELKNEDLVWYATFHQGREYNGFDKAVREGGVKAGTAKPGLQTHIHVVVSRRDVSQKISLTPTGRKERFSIQDWQKQNAESFRLMFGYEKQTYFDKSANKEQNLRTRLEKLSKVDGLTPSYFDPERIVRLAKKQEFSWKFYRNLQEVEYALKQGVRPPDPYGRLFSQFGKPGPQKESLLQETPLVNRAAAKVRAVEQSQSTQPGVQPGGGFPVGFAADAGRAVPKGAFRRVWHSLQQLVCHHQYAREPLPGVPAPLGQLRSLHGQTGECLQPGCGGRGDVPQHDFGGLGRHALRLRLQPDARTARAGLLPAHIGLQCR